MKSSVRNWIALGIVYAIIFLGVTGKIDPDKMMTLGGLIIGFYFGEKSALKNPGTQ